MACIICCKKDATKLVSKPSLESIEKLLERTHVYHFCSDNSDNKTFWCNFIFIKELPVSFHNISMCFHYFQIDGSNKVGCVAVANFFKYFFTFTEVF